MTCWQAKSDVLASTASPANRLDTTCRGQNPKVDLTDITKAFTLSNEVSRKREAGSESLSGSSIITEWNVPEKGAVQMKMWHGS